MPRKDKGEGLPIPTEEQIKEAIQAAEANKGNTELQVRALGLQALRDQLLSDTSTPEGPSDTNKLKMDDGKSQ